MSTQNTWASALGGAALAAMLALSAGCSQDQCSVDPRFPDDPVPALECPSDRLCYRGDCVRGCTAGRERFEVCQSDDDCEGARPNCIDGFCSSCESGERCVPVLDICRSVSSIPLPQIPDAPEPGRPRPPGPRDAGVLDAGLIRRRDAGSTPIPIDRPISHAVFVDLAETEVLTATSVAGSIAIRSFNVEGNGTGVVWRLDTSRPTLEELVTADGDCEINRFRVPTSTPTAADFGIIQIDDFDGSGAFPSMRSFRADWNATRRAYVLTPAAIPQPLLQLSNLQTLDSTFVTVTGQGAENLTDGAWPDPEVSLHVPFVLTPEPATRTLLLRVQELGQNPSRDLVFRWQRVDTGVVATERVLVRIPGRTHELSCRQIEGPNTPGSITVSAGLLDRFRMEDAAPAGTTYPLILERASAQQLQVDPEPERPNVRLFVSVRVRHTLEGRVRF